MTTNVHILGPTFSNFVRSVMLACEEKSIAYDTGLTVEGKKVGFHSPEHFALHPYGKVPILLHGDNSLTETASILRYLDGEFEGLSLQPKSNIERAQCDQWCAIISIYIDKAILRDYLLELVFPKGEDGKPRFDKINDAKPAALKALKILARQLGEQDYLLGDKFTLADALAAPMLDYLEKSPNGFRLLATGSKLEAYVHRLQARESGKKVLVKPEIP